MPYEIAPTTSFPTEAHAQEHLEGLIEDEGFHAVYDPLDELFGEPIAGYSLY